jgi:hypothetical protein
MRCGALTVGVLVTVAAAGMFRSVRAQERRDVSGVVRAAADSSALVSVHVRVLDVAVRAESDADGRFLLRGVPRATVRLVFERIGIGPDTVTVPAGRNVVEVYLRVRPVAVSPLVTEAESPARERFEQLAQTSTASLDPIEIANAPTPLEPDIARVAQLLPGTVAKNDFSVGLNVRGGEADQNLVRLDGITVFNPFHLGGLFSTFDPSAVERVDLLTGAFPASYGDRMSSVMDIGLRSGSRAGVGVHAAVSLLSSRVLVDGPIGHTGATFLVGARRTYTDLLTGTLSSRAFPYYFGDGVAKLSIPVGAGSIAATGYWGRDALDVPWVEPDSGRDGVNLAFSWGNRLAGVTWIQPIGSVVLENHVSVSDFSTRFALTPNVQDAENSVRQIAARTGIGFRIAHASEIRLGVGVEDHRIKYAFHHVSANAQVPIEIRVSGQTIPYDFRNVAIADQALALSYRPRLWYAYLDDQWRPASMLLIRPGVRIERADGAGFTGVSPRLAAKVFLTPDLALTASAGRYYQALYTIRDQEVPITLFDFWIGADSTTPVARADQAVLGLERWFGRSISLQVEAYAKRYDNLPLRNINDDPRIHGDEFVIATGNAWGVDVLLRRYEGRVRGWIAYSLAKTTRDAGGASFPPAQDRRHTVNVVIEAPGPWGGSLNVRWGFGSGLPYTGITGQWTHREYNPDLDLFEKPITEAVSTTVNGERSAACGTRT